MGKSKKINPTGQQTAIDQQFAVSNFKKQVYQWCKKIPHGKVATYGQLADLAGKPRAARAVGLFMKTNPDAPRTPCHRVVATDGSLRGYSLSGGVKRKKQLLLKEGVSFKGERVDMKLSQWKIQDKNQT